MQVWLWIGFIAFVLVMLAIDLGVLNRKDHVVSAREALTWTCVWVAISLMFNVLVYFMYEHHWLNIGTHMAAVGEGAAGVADTISGKQAALEFFTGYVIEKSLSLDNIFVIALIFAYFGVPLAYQHRVLFWGILGALVMRGAMIAAGTALIHRFNWIIYVFGGLLILTAIKLLLAGDEKIDPERNVFVRMARRFYPVTHEFHGHHFFVHIDGKRTLTPMMLALLVVESTDVLFAVDSIPAIFAITRDPFIVFTSNIFAILGLRSLYFALAAVMDKFRYLKHSLVFLLAFVGVKMLLSHSDYKVPTPVALAVIAGILAVGIFASLIVSSRENKHGVAKE